MTRIFNIIRFLYAVDIRVAYGINISFFVKSLGVLPADPLQEQVRQHRCGDPCASDDSPSGRRARARERMLRETLSLTSVPFVHKLFDRRLDRLQLEM